MYILAPSILAADFGNLKEEITRVADAGAQYIHLDVMDGDFVPSISFGMPVIKCIRKFTDAFLDAHLMVNKPERYIEDIADCGADGITIHAEACTHLDRALTQIKDLGLKAGVSLNPATPLQELEYVLEKVDMVLLMTVNPGFGGQKYLESCTNKIMELRKMIEDRNLDVDIQVDGGITLDNVKYVAEAGANIFVAGSSVFNGNQVDNVKGFLEIFQSLQV